MPQTRFRSPRSRVPVNGEASGAAPVDGNHTNDTTSWLFANESWDDADVPMMLYQLMEFTVDGHLAWVVFPREGFRFE